MWVIGLIVLAAFIAFLFFTPPIKVETAEKLLENNNYSSTDLFENERNNYDTDPTYGTHSRM